MNNNNVKHPYLILFVLGSAIFALMNTEVGLIGAMPSIKEVFHITSAQAGYLVSIYALVVALAGPFVVYKLQKYHPKTVLSFAVGAFFLSSLLSIFATNYTVLLLSRIFPAFFNSVIWSISLTVAANSLPPEKRGRATSLVGIGFIMALIFGVPLTSFFAETFSYKEAFIFCAVMNGLILLATLFLLPKDLPQGQDSGKKENPLDLLFKSAVWLNMFTTFFVYSGLFASYSFIKEYLVDVSGFSGSFTTILLFLFGLIGVIGNDIIGRLIRDDNMRKVMFVFLLSYILMYSLGYYFAASQLMMYFVIFAWGILFNAGMTVSQIWGTMNTQTSPEFGNSLYVSAVNLGISIGTFIGGIFITYYGIHSITLGSMYLELIALVLFFTTILLKGHQQSLFK